MERGVAAAGEGFPSHQLRSIVHQGATARASFNFRGDGLFDAVVAISDPQSDANHFEGNA